MDIGEWVDAVLGVITNLQYDVLDRQHASTMAYQQSDQQIETLREAFLCATDSTINAVAAQILDVLQDLLIQEGRPLEHRNTVLHHWTSLWEQAWERTRPHHPLSRPEPQ